MNSTKSEYRGNPYRENRHLLKVAQQVRQPIYQMPDRDIQVMPRDVRLEESVSSVRTSNLAMVVLFNNVGEVRTLKRCCSRNSNRDYRGMPEWLKGADCKSVG